MNRWQQVLAELADLPRQVQRIAFHLEGISSTLTALEHHLLKQEAKQMTSLTVDVEGSTVLADMFYLPMGAMKDVVFRPQLPLPAGWSFFLTATDSTTAVLGVMIGTESVTYSSDPYATRYGNCSREVEACQQLRFIVGPVKNQ